MNINIGTFLDPSFGGISRYLYLTGSSSLSTFDVSLFGIRPYPNRDFFKKISLFKLFYFIFCSILNRSFITLSFHGLFNPYVIMLSFLFGWLPRISIYVYPHGMLYESVLCWSNTYLKRLWLLGFRFVFRLCSPKIVCLSIPEASEALKIFPETSILIKTPALFPAPDASVVHDIIQDKFLHLPYKFVMFCRYSPEKQVDLVISAFSFLSHPNATLDIYGNASSNSLYYKHCKALASAHPMINLHDFIPSDEVISLLNTSHFCIVFSTKENLSFVLIEAALAGNIIITNSFVGAAHSFDSRDIFMSVDHDLDSLMKLFDSIMSTPIMQLEYRAHRSFNTAFEHFTY